MASAGGLAAFPGTGTLLLILGGMKVFLIATGTILGLLLLGSITATRVQVCTIPEGG